MKCAVSQERSSLLAPAHSRLVPAVYTRSPASWRVHPHKVTLVYLYQGQPLLVLSIHTVISHMLSCPPTPRSPASCLVHLHQGHPLPVMSIYTKVRHFLSCPSTLRSSIHVMSRPSTPRSPASCLVHLH